ncbi:MAG: PilN domain-containing protein, partial [Cyanobacteria bacterium]|nr:PilN domain-containing protein [Cyanobacteriota bacterium]MDW8203200.1 PilN domain-containing protein [Cyanobacteriota bacterium SKYGB_h_bin112]
MFSLDINFLNDPGRQDYTGAGKGRKGPQPGGGGGSYLPAILGALVGIALPAGVAGYWYYLNNIETPKLQARSSELDAQIAELQAKLKQAEEFNQQAAAIEADVAALSGVFNKIRPWSAILLDFAQRTPADVQLRSISESAGKLTISGVAVSQTS